MATLDFVTIFSFISIVNLLSCETKKCYNGGTFIESNETFNGFSVDFNSTESNHFCVCISGWEGQFCELPICATGSQNGTKCICDMFHSGVWCEKPICYNGGRSFQDDHVYKCQCISNFEGEFCQMPKCIHGQRIKPSYLRHYCKCDKGYSGIFCNNNKTISCNHGTTDFRGKCYCHTGYSGEFCDQIVCKYGSPVGTDTCQCYDESYKGKFCNCKHGVSDFRGKCHCISGYTGEFCHQMKCKYGYGTSNNTCHCYEGYKGKSCNKTICKHGLTDFRGKCHCYSGYIGELCDQIVCRYGNTTDNNTCQCYEGYSGKFCKKNKVRSSSNNIGWLYLMLYTFPFWFGPLCFVGCALPHTDCFGGCRKRQVRAEQNQIPNNCNNSALTRTIPITMESEDRVTSLNNGVDIDNNDQLPSYNEAMKSIFLSFDDLDRLPSYSEVVNSRF